MKTFKKELRKLTDSVNFKYDIITKNMNIDLHNVCLIFVRDCKMIKVVSVNNGIIIDRLGDKYYWNEINSLQDKIELLERIDDTLFENN